MQSLDGSGKKFLGYAETIFFVKRYMLSKLSQSEYETVRHLFAPLDYHLIIQAVIEGTSPGEIYVNDRNSPFTAFLCSSEGHYLAGNSEDAAFVESLQSLIAETLFAENDEIVLGIYPETWEPKLNSIFPKNRLPLKQHRKYYNCKQSKDAGAILITCQNLFLSYRTASRLA